MYALADYKDDRLQRIISKEIAKGFILNFGILPGKSPDPDLSETIFYGEPSFDDYKSAYAAAYVDALFHEITDQSAEYQFSQFGQRVLYNAVNFAKSTYMDMYSDPDEPEKIRLKSAEIHWKSSASEDDKDYVETFAESAVDGIYKDYRADLTEDYPECTKEKIDGIVAKQRSKDIDTFVRQCTSFPFMADDIDGDSIFHILFADTDFLLIDDIGMEKFVEARSGDIGKVMGMTQPSGMFTGSTRIPLTQKN